METNPARWAGLVHMRVFLLFYASSRQLSYRRVFKLDMVVSLTAQPEKISSSASPHGHPLKLLSQPQIIFALCVSFCTAPCVVFAPPSGAKKATFIILRNMAIR